jgi:hypothetical protein
MKLKRSLWYRTKMKGNHIDCTFDYWLWMMHISGSATDMILSEIKNENMRFKRIQRSLSQRKVWNRLDIDVKWWILYPKLITIFAISYGPPSIYSLIRHWYIHRYVNKSTFVIFIYSMKSCAFIKWHLNFSKNRNPETQNMDFQF